MAAGLREQLSACRQELQASQRLLQDGIQEREGLLGQLEVQRHEAQHCQISVELLRRCQDGRVCGEDAKLGRGQGRTSLSRRRGLLFILYPPTASAAWSNLFWLIRACPLLSVTCPGLSWLACPQGEGGPGSGGGGIERGGRQPGHREAEVGSSQRSTAQEHGAASRAEVRPRLPTKGSRLLALPPTQGSSNHHSGPRVPRSRASSLPVSPQGAPHSF